MMNENFKKKKKKHGLTDHSVNNEPARPPPNGYITKMNRLPKILTDQAFGN